MDTKEKPGAESKCREEKFEFPFTSAQKMSAMMKDCLPNEAISPGCCSMMATMMGCDKEGKPNQEQTEERSSKGGQAKDQA